MKKKSEPLKNCAESPVISNQPPIIPLVQVDSTIIPKNQRAPTQKKIEIERNNKIAYALLLQQRPTNYVLQRLMDGGLTVGQARLTIDKCARLLQDEGSRYRAHAYDTSVRHRLHLMELAQAKGQLGLAHEIRRDLDRLLDLYPADRKKGDAAQGFAQFFLSAQRKLAAGQRSSQADRPAIEVAPTAQDSAIVDIANSNG